MEILLHLCSDSTTIPGFALGSEQELGNFLCILITRNKKNIGIFVSATNVLLLLAQSSPQRKAVITTMFYLRLSYKIISECARNSRLSVMFEDLMAKVFYSMIVCSLSIESSKTIKKS